MTFQKFGASFTYRVHVRSSKEGVSIERDSLGYIEYIATSIDSDDNLELCLENIRNIVSLFFEKVD